MSRQRMALIGIVLVLLAGPAAAQTRGFFEFGDSWYPWRSVDVLLDEQGGLIGQSLRPDTIEMLEEQIKGFREKHGSAAKHGLDEGAVPKDDLCGTSYPRPKIIRPPGADHLDFVMMTSDVAVTATIGEMVMGFKGPSPAALVSLERVEPLHRHSPIPDYALVRLGRLVARDIVFCAWVDGKRGFDAQPGDRILIMGSWDRGVVRPDAMAVFSEDLASLEWWSGLSRYTIGEITESAHRVVASGLFDYAAEARHADDLTENAWELHVEVGGRVEQASADDCLLSGAVRTDEGWKLSRSCEQ